MVYSEGTNINRAWPFDIIPRTIAKSEWLSIEEGLKQRLTALNLFINDLYCAPVKKRAAAPVAISPIYSCKQPNT